ncbi:MAG: manno-octulosonate cytidylyltransferase [Saprospiraceae bacterium]|nr:manno-octulosonate cytidylyltransferase [Saprospiraceae bacterium]
MKILGVIPARYASTRFLGKPLVDINGKSMIQCVYEQAKCCKSLARVVVATDDERIFKHVESFGGDVVMTADTHQSGTDRCAEVVENVNFEIQSAFLNSNDAPVIGKITPRFEGIFTAVINIQGDEPFIQPEQIEKIADILRGGKSIATLAKRLTTQKDIDNPNIVKVVFDAQGKALYFSRSPIPFIRHLDKKLWAKSGLFFKHIGLYGYKTSVLLDIARLAPSNLEQTESLEQLRWLENGYDIGVIETDLETIGIDTPEDLKKIKKSPPTPKGGV